MDNESGNERSLVFSYLELRKAIGILGIALPFVVALGGLILFQTGLQSSISAYYHTAMGDVLVGTLFAIGFFLLSYRGFDRRDGIAGDLACIFFVGVALFPTAPQGEVTDIDRLVGYAHMVFTALAFGALIYFSLYLFPKTAPGVPPTKRKLQRNRVYKACGYIMAVCLVLIGVNFLLPSDIASSLAGLRPVFWLEAIAIWAFGISWFTKGEAILKDEFQPTD
jgi:hypothetical protein